MRLRDWLTENAITQTAFAEAIGRSQSFVSELCAGIYQPSLPLALKIEAATKGAVTPRELLFHDARDLPAISE